MNDIPIASTCANSPRLPQCLAALNKDDIIQIFLDMNDSNGQPMWSNASSVEQEFFQKLEGGFDFFLESTGSIERFPLEALILAYSQAEQTFIQDVAIIGWLYNDSRGGQIIPRSPVNIGSIKAVDFILDTYFSNLKNIKRLGKNKFERLVRNQILVLTITSYDKKDYVIMDFLSKFYLDHADLYLSSFLIQAICCATYGLNDVLTSSVNSFEESQNAENIQFFNKNKGVQFGTIVRSQDQNKHINTLFVKAHQNYPYKGPCRYLQSSSQSSSMSGFDIFANCRFLPPSSVDLKELFVYKVLEYTGFGPKAHFILNKNFESFLYIGTEEIEKFVTLGDFSIKKPELFAHYKNQFQILGRDMMQGTFQITDQDPNNIILELTIFDLVARSMLLCDLNEWNIGFALNPPEKTAIKAVDFMIPIPSKIRDMNIAYSVYIPQDQRQQFLLLMSQNPYVYYDLANSFLQTNTFTKYPDILLSGPFKPNFPDYLTHFANFETNKKKLGALAIKRLGHLDVIFNRAYTDICNFVNGNETFLALQRGLTASIITEGNDKKTDTMADLLQYKDAAIINFQRLSEFLKQ